MNNVNFIFNCSGYNLSGVMKISGNMNITMDIHGHAFNGGTIEVGGNISVTTSTAAVSGSTVIVLNGSTNQTVDLKSKIQLSLEYSPANIANTLTFNSGYTANDTTHSFVVNGGSVNMNGNSVSVKVLTLNSNTINKNSGTLTVNSVVAGTGSLYGGTVAP